MCASIYAQEHLLTRRTKTIRDGKALPLGKTRLALRLPGFGTLNPGPGPLQIISAGAGWCQSAAADVAIRLVAGTVPA